MLGIKYPIFQGAMAWVSGGELAGAVSREICIRDRFSFHI